SSGGSVDAVGGYNPSTYSYSRGGNITVSAASICLGGSICNGGWSGNNTSLTTGNIAISTSNTATTAGVNDGQVSGVITGGNFTKSGAGTFILKSVNTYIGTTTVSGGTLQLGAGNALPTSTALTVSGGAVFDLFSFSPTVGSIAGGGTIRSSSGSSTPVLTTGSDGTSTTFSGVIENGSATSVSLIKTGGGVLTLTGSSSYTGSTAINGGVINIQHANALGVSSATTVASGATLQLQGGIAVGALPLALKGVGVSSLGALRNISGNNTWGGTITTETPAVRINSDSGTLTLSGSTAISSSTNIGVTFGGSGNVTVSGAIGIGTAGLTKDGTGTLTLSSANTYSGATAVNAGVLNIQNGSALGTSSQTTIADGATLQMQGDIAVGSLPLRLNGAGVSSLGALRNISGNNSWSGTITALSASRIHSDAGVLTLSGANAISASNMGVTFGGSGDVVVSGTITTGTGSLTKEGSGTLTLSGTNTYTGATTITSGTLVLGASQVIANTSNVVMNGGTLNTNGFTETVGQLLLQNNSTLVLGSGVHTLTFSSAGTFSFKRLTITGWQGSYGSGSSGTAGQVFVGSGAVLTREQLDQIQFFDGTATYYAVQLSTGEVVPGANTSTSPTGHSNVQVTTLATAGGSWSALTGGTYTFTPSADNANINVTDIQNRILGSGFTRGNVTIVTANSTGGTQVGNVNIATSITALNPNNNLTSFTVIANGDINVSSAINLSGSTAGYSNVASTNVVLTSSRSINLTSSINTSGSSVSYSSIGATGSITLTASDRIYSSSGGSLDAVGGYNPSNYSYSRGGNITLSAASISLGGSISNGGWSGNNTSLTTGNIAISTSNTATTAGVNDGQVSGVITGGNFTKSGAGTFILKSVNTYVGSTTVSAGTLRLGAANSVPSTSGLVLAGGELQSAGFGNTFASITLSANSTLRLGSGVHTITFTTLGSFTTGTILRIEDWQGTYASPGTTGTAGRIVFTPTTSATILGQLKFNNSSTGNLHTSIQLGTKEIVAGNQ
ncbi:MAG: beta strand repeat-containing protein, partial [Bacteroidota bacterium]